MKFRNDPKPRRNNSWLGCLVSGVIVILVTVFLMVVAYELYRVVVR